MEGVEDNRKVLTPEELAELIEKDAEPFDEAELSVNNTEDVE